MLIAHITESNGVYFLNRKCQGAFYSMVNAVRSAADNGYTHYNLNRLERGGVIRQLSSTVLIPALLGGQASREIGDYGDVDPYE